MQDLKDGETFLMKGSAKEPYQLKRVGVTYSCSCPAWKNQSSPINKRTCKHIRKLRGDDAESARIGGSLTVRSPKRKDKITAVAPAILLAETWNKETDPTGYSMSEKLDGVRAYWDGKQFLSRLGNKFFVPEWYTKGFPNTQLDGEFWIGRKKFQEAVSIVRTQGLDEPWKKIKYMIFDSPEMETEKFEKRYKNLWDMITGPTWEAGDHVILLDQIPCKGYAHLSSYLQDIENKGGEGVMLRQPGSFYEGCRSSTLLKVKSFEDGEAIILEYEDGKKGGNREGMVGAFIVEAINGRLKGKKFKVGTGQSHKILKDPPPIGSKITFRYIVSALSDDGLPKPASFVGLVIDK